MKNCDDCETRDVCVELCSEVEAEVNQDYVGQSELPMEEEKLAYLAYEKGTLADVQTEYLESKWYDLTEEQKEGLIKGAKLTVKQTESLILSFDGYNQREIGDMLGISKMSVNNRLNWARKKLEKYILSKGR